MAYFSLVRPKLEYAVSIWDPHTTKDVSKLDSVQRKAARFVTGDFGKRSSVTSMLDELEWPPLQHRRRERNSRQCVLSYKILNVEVDVTSPLQKSPRETEHCYIVPNSHLHSFYPSTVRVWIWNNLPYVAAKAETAETFKSMVKMLDHTGAMQ